jgi:hypothetical protein
MKQKDFQTIINKNFNHIPDSLINFSDVNECEFLADKLSFMGYGQNAEGYFKHGNVPNPSQKFHLAEAYFEYKFSKMKDKECFKDCELGRIRCPQLMLWIAEIVQIPESVLKDAYNYIVKAEDELFHKKGIKKGLLGADKYWDTMRQNSNITLSEFKTKLKYTEICKIIKSSNNWEEIISNCQKLDFKN